jgi:hypothetical protein
MAAWVMPLHPSAVGCNSDIPCNRGPLRARGQRRDSGRKKEGPEEFDEGVRPQVGLVPLG